MPTEPLKKLLDRDLRKVESNNSIEISCQILQEIVNYGTNVFGRCESGKRPENIKNIPEEGHLAILLLYLHVIEMIDAIEVCISQSVIIPSQLQVRSAFEAFLQLEWLLKEDTLNRVCAYLVYDVRNRIKIYQSQDPSSQEGKQFKAKLAKDKWASSMTLPTVPNLAMRIKNLEDFLAKPPFDAVNAAYNSKIPWHGLSSGPKSTEQLAIKLDHSFWYDWLYRQWSQTTHATYPVRGSLKKGDIRVLRANSELRNIVGWIVPIGIYATEAILKCYRSGEISRFWKWFQDNIAPPLKTVTDIEQVQNEKKLYTLP